MRALLAGKDSEIAALRASHSAPMDQLEHASLGEENSKLKGELAKAVASLETEKSTNSANHKGLFDIFKVTPPSVSKVITPSQPSQKNPAIYVCVFWYFDILLAN